MRFIVRLSLMLCGGTILALAAAATLTRREVRTPPAAWIAFVHYGPVTSTLYRARVVGGTPQVITEARTLSRPTWSPGGRWLAFSAVDAENHSALYRVRPDGSGLHRLTPPAWEATTPDWSPDGAWLVYVEWSAVTAPLYRIRPDGTDREALTTATWRDTYRAPTWSPDGAWIAFAHATGDDTIVIEIIRAEGGERRTLTPEHTLTFAPDWSPDSRWITFQAILKANETLIYRLAVTGGDAIPVSPPTGYSAAPAWSPDGAWLLFARKILPYRTALYRVHPDGTGLEQLIDFPQSLDSPAWGPPVAGSFRPGRACALGIACFVASFALPAPRRTHRTRKTA